MFDLSWGEIAFVAVLALIVVGPRDLPRLARGVGQVVGRMQRLYREQMFNLRRLENEIDAAQITPDGKPAFHSLLPEHVRQAMAEPVADTSESAPATEAAKPS